MQFPHYDTVIDTPAGHKNVLIQDEFQENRMSGTTKDRRSSAIIAAMQDWIQQGDLHAFAMITAGNAALSLAKTLRVHPDPQVRRIPVRAVMDINTPPDMRAAVERSHAEVTLTDLSSALSPEELIGLVRRTPEERIEDVTSGYSSAYRRVFSELDLANRWWRSHKNVVCPVGSGELFVGLYEHLQQQWRNSFLDVTLVGVTVESRMSIASALRGPHRPYQRILDEAVANGHKIITLDEDGVRRAMALVPDVLRDHVEPSSAVVFGALETVGSFDDTVLINTGRGIGGALPPMAVTEE